MPARISYVKHTLDYPPWALDFDPYNRGYAVVGGGGGQGQKEVPNRLSLLDLRARDKVHNVAELDVVDDSPSSLGLLASKDGLYTFSGINATASDRKSGKNEHFRSYQIGFPQKPKSGTQKEGSIKSLAKTELFASHYAKSDDAFQRLLRLSPPTVSPTGSKRIGAIASSLSSKSELVLFNATVATPNQKDVIHRLTPADGKEVNDLDIFETAEGEFKVAYCTNSELYLANVSYDFAKSKLKQKVAEPELLRETRALEGASGNSQHGKYRSLRFISHNHLLLMINRDGGTDLLLLKIYAKGGPADVVLRKRLSKSTSLAVSLDVSRLGADETTGEEQVVIAIAAQARDISLLTIDVPGKGSPKAFTAYKDLPGVHEAPMKKVVLAPFRPPPAVLNNAKLADSDDQYLRLGSISLSNTVDFEYIPLEPIKTKSGKVRYVANHPSSIIWGAANVVVLAVVLAAFTVLLQMFLDNRAGPGQVANIQLLPAPVSEFIRNARKDYDPVKHVIHEVVEKIEESDVQDRIADLVDQAKAQLPGVDLPRAVVISPSEDGQLSSEVHDDREAVKQDPNAKRWDELTKKQQESWKQRLIKAGQWTTGEGEKILKSVFFSEVAGAIGRAALG